MPLSGLVVALFYATRVLRVYMIKQLLMTFCILLLSATSSAEVYTRTSSGTCKGFFQPSPQEALKTRIKTLGNKLLFEIDLRSSKEISLQQFLESGNRSDLLLLVEELPRQFSETGYSVEFFSDVLKALVRVLEDPLKSDNAVFKKPEHYQKTISYQLLSKNSLKLWADLVEPKLMVAVVEALLKHEYSKFEGKDALELRSKFGRDLISNLDFYIEVLGRDHRFFNTIRPAVVDSRASIRLMSERNKLPEGWREAIMQAWGTTEVVNSTQKTGITLIPRSDPRLSSNCGACSELAVGHVSSLTKNYNRNNRWKTNFGRTTFVEYQGEVIGSVKHPEAGTGAVLTHQSLLALKNVYNEKGELVLMAGGVYEPPNRLAAEVAALGSSNLSKAEKFNTVSIEASELLFKPIVFIERPHDKQLCKGDCFRDLVVELVESAEAQLN